MSPTNLARVSGISIDSLLSRQISPTEIIPDEENINREIALFVGKVMKEAHNMLDSGSPVTKLRLMAIILPKLAAQLGKTTSKEIDTLREDFLELTSSIAKDNVNVSSLDETD